jgi:hypothetical protein
MSDIKFDNILKDQLARAVRYAYPGFLAAALLGVNYGDEFNTLLTTVGLSFLVIFAFVFGAAIYVLYRFVVGECLLFHLVHLIHRLAHKIFKLQPGVVEWLVDLGVPLGQRRAAYTYLRSKKSDDKEVQYLDYIHTELHILYITGIELCGFGIYLSTDPQKSGRAYIWVSVAILLAGILADIRSHISEARYWRYSNAAGPQFVTKLLAEGGFFDPMRPGQQSSKAPISA